MRLPSIFPNALAFLTFIAAPLQTAGCQTAEAPPGPAAGHASSNLPQADPAKEFKLPGLVVNQKDRCVDLDATVCLRQGALELIACTKGTKEHESIVAVEAKPIHIHTALLLLGVPAGNPAMRKPQDEKGTRWIDVPPRGGAVDVFLVVKDKQVPKTIPRTQGINRDWIDAIRNGKKSCSDFSYAGPLTETILLGTLAIRTGKTVKWNAEKLEIIGNPEAAKLINPQAREGWRTKDLV